MAILLFICLLFFLASTTPNTVDLFSLKIILFRLAIPYISLLLQYPNIPFVLLTLFIPVFLLFVFPSFTFSLFSHKTQASCPYLHHHPISTLLFVCYFSRIHNSLPSLVEKSTNHPPYYPFSNCSMSHFFSKVTSHTQTQHPKLSLSNY